MLSMQEKTIKKKILSSYQGDYSSEELKELAIKEVRDAYGNARPLKILVDCYVHIESQLKSETPVEWIYD